MSQTLKQREIVIILKREEHSLIQPLVDLILKLVSLVTRISLDRECVLLFYVLLFKIGGVSFFVNWQLPTVPSQIYIPAH